MRRNLLRVLGKGVAAPGQGSSSPSAHLFDAALAAINAADVIARAPDDEGPRVAIIAPGLGGAFYWNHDEAKRRIQTHFNLSERDTRRVVSALRARVKIAASPALAPRRRGGWVHGWRNDNPGLFVE